MRGYFGIGLLLPKHEVNVGTLLRSAHSFGAAYMFTVGKRYDKQHSDTTKAWRHVPLFHYASITEMFDAVPYSCIPIAVERTEGAQCITTFTHPERAVYLLGPEDGDVPREALQRCVSTIIIPGEHCLNVATAGTIVMYDRVRQHKSEGNR